MTTIPQKGLRPLDESFPNSAKVAVGDFAVPARDIRLTNGDVVRVYDTTGPQGCSPLEGLPKRRQPWWHWMAAGLLGLLCLEAFLSRRG